LADLIRGILVSMGIFDAVFLSLLLGLVLAVIGLTLGGFTRGHFD
jgi:hypothetical protein